MRRSTPQLGISWLTVLLALLAGISAGAAIGLLAGDGGRDAVLISVLAAALLGVGALHLGRREQFTASPQLLHEAIEAMPIPIAVYDRDSRLRAANALYRSHHPDWFGDPARVHANPAPTYEDLIAAGLSPLLSPTDRAERIEEIIKRQPPDNGRLVERRFPRLGWLRVGTRRLPGGGTVRAGIEINELKNREAQLLVAIRESHASDEAKGKFLSTISHELRTPLNGIIGMANLLLTGRMVRKDREKVETIRTSGLHLLDLINRVLEFSELSRDGQDGERVAFDLCDMLDEVLAEARAASTAAGLDLFSDVSPEIPRWRLGDRRGLRQVLTNLIGNAAKFTEAGEVRVTLGPGAAGPGSLRVEVRDTGIGVPADKRDTIFQPFAQADGSITRRYGGTGLGLTISAEIIERMGGKIGVNSGAGEGSTFWFDVPLDVSTRMPEAVESDRVRALPRAIAGR